LIFIPENGNHYNKEDVYQIMEDETVTINIETYPLIPNLKTITIEGNFDISTSQQVDEKVSPVIEREKTNIILDISKLNYLSSIAIRRLIEYQLFMTDEKRLLKLVKPPEHIYNTLVAAGVADKFDMYDSILAAAISSFR
jgi:anti-anti-sigma factor